MNKNALISQLLFCLLFFSLPSAAQKSEIKIEKNNERKVISVRADTWMPYNGDPKANLPGYMIEIAAYAFQKHGYQLDYQLLPWERSLELLSKGKIDCVVGAFKTKDRHFVFNEIPAGKEDVAFYGRTDARHWVYTGIDAFEGFTLGVIGGYSYGREVDFYVANPNNDVFFAKGEDALERNIKMLLSKRIDILVESPTIFEFKTRNMPSGVYIKELDRQNKPQDVYFACSPVKKESEQYAQWLDEGIIELRKTGKLKKILKKYGMTDWETNPDSPKK